MTNLEKVRLHMMLYGEEHEAGISNVYVWAGVARDLLLVTDAQENWVTDYP